MYPHSAIYDLSNNVNSTMKMNWLTNILSAISRTFDFYCNENCKEYYLNDVNLCIMFKLCPLFNRIELIFKI